ncbi:MAG: metalloprotease [Nanoarchaeales archaeon]|nr:metalloprotease [Nanoarchaeales archaeon]
MADFVEFKEVRKKVKLFNIGKYKFSDIEIKHLTIAMIMIILSIFVHNYGLSTLMSSFLSKEFFIMLGIYALTIGTGFIFHELGHKLVAQHYQFISEFRADFQMLGIMFIMAVFLPILFLAPGAVMILGRPTIRQNGIISVAGPLVNLGLAIIFTFIALVFGTQGILGTIVMTGIIVNSFLGIFNMLPMWVLDGKKVWAWSKPVWTGVMLILIIFLMIGYGNIPLLV